MAKSALTYPETKTCPKCGQAVRSKLIPLKGGGIDPAGFARLVRANFDARPDDVEGSFAWGRKKARAAAAAKKAAKK